jgi:hypothetical protein
VFPDQCQDGAIIGRRIAQPRLSVVQHVKRIPMMSQPNQALGLQIAELATPQKKVIQIGTIRPTRSMPFVRQLPMPPCGLPSMIFHFRIGSL